MATSKKPQPPERTKHALPMPASLDAGFASLNFTHKKKHYALTMTVNITTDSRAAARWMRQVAWTHASTDLHGFAEPQRVTGFLAPSEFVLRGAGSRVEMTLDVERDNRGIVVPIITSITNRRRADVPLTLAFTDKPKRLAGSDSHRLLRFPAELPPLRVITEKAARLAFVAGRATAPGEYAITEFARGEQRDVKNLSDHPWPWHSPEAIELFLSHYNPATYGRHGAKDEYRRVAKETGWEQPTVEAQRRIAVERGLLKLPPKGQTE